MLNSFSVSASVLITPPSLLPLRNNGEAFGIVNHDLGKREEIKLLIEFMLQNNTHGNDATLF